MRIVVASLLLPLWAVAGPDVGIKTNPTPAQAPGVLSNSAAAGSPTNRAVKAEQMRTTCIEGRRYVCGRVLQIVPDGLVVDSGYSALLKPPFNQSWVVRGTASVERDASAVEEKRPDAVCVGLVFLTGYPKRPAVKDYDYVVIHAYPAGEHEYVPVPGVQKTVRRFSASLERAVALSLEVGEK